MPDMNDYAIDQLTVGIWGWLTDPVVITVFLVVLGTMTCNFAARRVLERLALKASVTSTVWDDGLVNAIRQPLKLMIWVLALVGRQRLCLLRR